MGTVGQTYLEGAASARRIEALIETIQDSLLRDAVICQALESCDLQPTTRAARLAAASAVNVILAHELGQEVAQDEAAIEAADGASEE